MLRHGALRRVVWAGAVRCADGIAAGPGTAPVVGGAARRRLR